MTFPSDPAPVHTPPAIDRRMVAVVNTHRLVAPTSDEALFCFKVWKRRVDLQVGLKAAAKASGCSVATVSRVENGSMPDLPTFVRLCRWTGLSLEEGVEALRVETAPAVPAP